ncbi:MAG: hypothetical protein ACLU7D_09620 [Collinsella sp.]
MNDTAQAEKALKAQQELTDKLERKLSDQERRDTLARLLNTVPQSSIRTFYKPAFEELAALDPQDTTGIRAALERKELLKTQSAEMVQNLRENNFYALAAKEPDKAIAILDNSLKKEGLLPEIRQSLLLTKVRLLIQRNEVNEVEEILKSAIALLPDSDEGRACSRLLADLPNIRKERENLKPGEQPPLPPGAIPAAKCIVPPAAKK